MVEGEDLQKILDAMGILAKEDAWETVDAIVEYVAQFSYKIEFRKYVIDAMRAGNSENMHDLGATLFAKMSKKDIRTYNRRFLKSLVIGTPEEEKGIYHSGQYAQLRFVIAAIEHDMLTKKQWLDPAKPVLQKHLEEMKDVVAPYLGKGQALYEKSNVD